MALRGQTAIQLIGDTSLAAEYATGHWFDNLAREIAGGKLSRRQALGWTLQGGLAVAYATLFRSAGAFAQAPPRPSPQEAIPPISVGTTSVGGCIRRVAGNSFVQEVTVDQAGMTFKQQMAYDHTKEAVTNSLIIRRGQTLILKVDATTAKGGAATVTVRSGADIKGVQTVSTTTRDGRTFQGSMDGRSFTTNRTSRPHHPLSLSPLTFSDGRPAPHISVDPQLAKSISDIVGKARAASASCRKVMPAPMRPTRHRLRELGQGGSPGDGWYEPGGTYDAPACSQCSDNCTSTCNDDCGVGDWETYVCGPGCIAAAYACANLCWAGCWGTCQLPGGGCCPVPCGGPFTCFGRGDQCFRGDLCCPSPFVVCKDVCCGIGVTGCAPDGFCGCLAGELVCGDNCCPPDTMCCGSHCCPTTGNMCCGDQCCPQGNYKCCGGACCPGDAPCLNNTTCCASPSYVCGGTCCAPFSNCCAGACCDGQCCGSTCCKQGDVCLKDGYGNIVGCCPPAQVCGYSCCASGQKCIDPHEGTCAACPRGTVPTVCGTATGAPGPTVCCPPGVLCCNGKCCPFPSDNRGNVVCCTPPAGDSPPFANGSFGCHHQAACIA